MEEVIEDIINMESSFNDEGIGCSETPLLMQRTVSISWNSILMFIIENLIDTSTCHTSEVKAVLSVDYSPFFLFAYLFVKKYYMRGFPCSGKLF